MIQNIPPFAGRIFNVTLR